MGQLPKFNTKIEDLSSTCIPACELLHIRVRVWQANMAQPIKILTVPNRDLEAMMSVIWFGYPNFLQDYFSTINIDIYLFSILC